MKARIALLALVAIASPAGAEMDKPRLRQLAKLPTVNVLVGIGFSTTYGFLLNDDKPDPRREIARIRKELKSDASDVERYLRLGLLYHKADREKDSDDAYAKAVALCRQQVKEHPDEMHGLAQLGDALATSGQMKEGEALLRRAVKQAPDEWRAWLGLGQCLDSRTVRAVLGEDRMSSQFFNEKVLIPALLERKPTAEQIAEMRRLHEEARRCYDRAIALVPRETKSYFRRIGSNWMHATLEGGLRTVGGEKVNMMAALFEPECAADIRRIARLCPDDAKAVGSALLVEVVLCSSQQKIDGAGASASFADSQRTEDRSPVDLLPVKSRAFVRWGMARLEQLTKSTDKGTAADASEILADTLMGIYMQGDDADDRPSFLRESGKKALSQILEHLRRTVRLDPSRQCACDFLMLLLADKGRTEEAIRVARDRLKSEDNAHNRFMLAKVHADRDQFADAAEQLRAGLKSDENDLNCLLGLIVVLLHRDDAAALAEAGKSLEAVQARMKRERNRQHWTDFLLLQGLHAALCGRPERARQSFERILNCENNRSARQALDALGGTGLVPIPVPVIEKTKDVLPPLFPPHDSGWMEGWRESQPLFPHHRPEKNDD